jgi:hypothetical protein
MVQEHQDQGTAIKFPDMKCKGGCQTAPSFAFRLPGRRCNPENNSLKDHAFHGFFQFTGAGEELVQLHLLEIE